MRRLTMILLLGAAFPALADSVLTLHFQERPPYSAAAPNGQVRGLVADPAARALQAAGLAFTWTLTPSQRQLALIQGDATGLHCGVGWFRNAAREALGQFSAPLYRDQPLAALVRTDAWGDSNATAAALLATPRLRLLVKDGYSYGPRLDALIASALHRPLRTSVEPAQMARMLASGRADWMPVAPEEARALLTGDLRLVPLTDEPQGQSRHLYCSRNVPAEWMARIDRALAAAR